MSEDFLLPVLPFNSKYSNKKIKLESLMEYPLLLREKGGSIGRNLIDSIFEMHNIKNTICMESESTQAIINAVHSGIGISFLPNGMIKKHL